MPRNASTSAKKARTTLLVAKRQKAGRCTGPNALANGFVTKNAMMIIFTMSWPTFFHHAVPDSNLSADPHLQK